MKLADIQIPWKSDSTFSKKPKPSISSWFEERPYVEQNRDEHFCHSTWLCLDKKHQKFGKPRELHGTHSRRKDLADRVIGE